MNNLIFNTEAKELKTSIYGENDSKALSILQLDSSNNLRVIVTNTSLTVAGTVTVGNSITIANSTITTIISGNTFTSLELLNNVVSSSSTTFNNTDISQLRTASILFYNEGANPITISLQISPTTNVNYYMDSPNYSNIVVAGNSNQFIAITEFAHYVQLSYNPGSSTCTFSAYFNGQA